MIKKKQQQYAIASEDHADGSYFNRTILIVAFNNYMHIYTNIVKSYMYTSIDKIHFRIFPRMMT
jgi:hypothetical protein